MNLLGFLITFFALLTSCASPIWFDGQGKKTDLNSKLQLIPKGSIIVLGESHSYQPHQSLHVEIMQALRELGHQVSVGFEFFDYVDQAVVNRYHQGQISEEQFLTEIRWNKGDYKFYRERATFAQYSRGEDLIALNLPRWVSGQIAKKGLKDIDESAKALLPPKFTLGNDLYFDRFKVAVGDHLPVELIDNSFAAQCSWDETMSWVATDYVSQKPTKTLVIIVGDFHVQYGGGLPDRLKSRLSECKECGQKNVFPISFIRPQDYDPVEAPIENDIKPHPVYGERAFITGVN